jgi:hypothetical protein
VRVIRRTNQRAGLDVAKPEPETDALQFGEFRRRVVSRYRQVGERWPQVLTDRHDLAAGGAQVVQRRDDLVPCFAEAHHEA